MENIVFQPNREIICRGRQVSKYQQIKYKLRDACFQITLVDGNEMRFTTYYKHRKFEMTKGTILPTLMDIVDAHRGNISDKWEQYFEIYESELESIRLSGKSVSLLEIGVQNGGSLEIWKAFLPENSLIVGIDVDPRCAEIMVSEGITIMVGNATDPNVFVGLPVDVFDIIIDDGSHFPGDVRRTFNHLKNRLRFGGMYIVEDIHCSYWSGYGDGLGRCNSVAEWGKSFVDALNFDHIQVEDRDASPVDTAWLMELNHQVDRISFYDSLIVIRMRRERKSAAYRRVLSGGIISIENSLAWWKQLNDDQRAAVRLNEAARQCLLEESKPRSFVDDAAVVAQESSE